MKLGGTQQNQQNASTNRKTSTTLVNQTVFGIHTDAIAGGMAGGAARLVTSPFDVLKIRFQLQSHVKPKYNGMYSAIRTIVKEEGFVALWKGNLSATYLYGSYAMVQFSSYRYLKNSLLIIPDPFESFYRKNNDSTTASTAVAIDSKKNTSWKALMLFIAGAGAGILATMITYPLDLMRTQFALQGQVKVYNHMSAFIKHTYKTQGFIGFYAGLGPALLGVAPYMGLNFAIYEVLNKYLESLTDSSRVKKIVSKEIETAKKDEHGIAIVHPAPPVAVVSPPAHNTSFSIRDTVYSIIKLGAVGGISGGLSKFIVFPLDTIKRRLQSQVLNNTIDSTNIVLSNTLQPRYRSILHCISSIYRHEGMRGFYKGIIPTTAKSVVATAITFAAYETTRDFMVREQEQAEKRL